MNKNSVLKFIVLAAMLLNSALAFAQNDTDSLKEFIEDVKADKKALILANMDLTETQKEQFIPIYDAYQAELKKLNERIASLISNYAFVYNSGKITEDAALQLLEELFSIENREAEIKGEYSKKLLAVISAVKVAKYMQMENKIRAIIKYELASQIPLAY